MGKTQALNGNSSSDFDIDYDEGDDEPDDAEGSLPQKNQKLKRMPSVPNVVHMRVDAAGGGDLEGLGGVVGLGTDASGRGNYPNMVFVPLKVEDPAIPAREFAIYLGLLTVFMIMVNAQHFRTDFEVNDSMQALCGMNQLKKVSTIDDYVAWWPVLLNALRQWAVSGADRGIGTQAQLVGVPFFTQKIATAGSKLTLDPTSLKSIPSFEVKTVMPPFNATDRQTGIPQSCPWPLSNASAEVVRQWPEWVEAQDILNVTENAGYCYTASTDRFGSREYYNPHMRGILNGTYDWAPDHWITANTLELSHHFEVYYPALRRFAVVKITLSLDSTGRLVLSSLDGDIPSFTSHEPFIYETDPHVTIAELVFFAVIAYTWIGEVFEIWACLCITEQLLPLKLLTTALELKLKEIEYYHERASEVYDPRDPRTGKAFSFPDVADLHAHIADVIEPRKVLMQQLDQQLAEMKVNLAALGRGKMEMKKERELQKEMEALQLMLMNTDRDIRRDTRVVEVAGILQLSVMWKNNWGTAFPPSYLQELAHDQKLSGDPAEAFRDVNWITVAQEYVTWTTGVPFDNEGGEPKSPNSRSQIAAGENAIVFKQCGMFSNHPRKHDIPQQKHFSELEGIATFMQTLRDALELHKCIVDSRLIKYWNGPRNRPLSTTIVNAFQRVIQTYNTCGKALQSEMRDYCEEIETGFSEPNLMKAETIRIKAQSLEDNLVSQLNVAGVLGFYFPGSPLWDANRDLRANVRESDSFWQSMRSFGLTDLGLVSRISLQLYLQEGQSAINGGEVLNPVSDDENQKRDRDLFETASFDKENDGDSGEDPVTIVVAKRGIDEWRNWVPQCAERLVNYDGQVLMDLGTIDMPPPSFSNPLGWLFSMPDVLASHSAKLLKGNEYGGRLYRVSMWIGCGIKTYMADPWNIIEFGSYTLFMISFFCKVKMLLMADEIENQRVDVQNFKATFMASLDRYASFQTVYLITTIINAVVMWTKLFKYIGVIPQMGILLKVLGRAGPSIAIFSFVALIPCMGLSLAYHAAFGGSVKNYSTVSRSVNTVMRMAVGDFDFSELYDVAAPRAIALFWISSILIAFVLINIFVAIIMSAYDAVLTINPDANDASSFVSIVMMQARRVFRDAFSNPGEVEHADDLTPHVLLHKIEPIEAEDYWDIFESYFSLDEDEKENADEADTRAALAKAKSQSDGAAMSVSVDGSAEALFLGLSDDIAGLRYQVDELTKLQQAHQREDRERIRAVESQQEQMLELIKALAAAQGIAPQERPVAMSYKQVEAAERRYNLMHKKQLKTELRSRDLADSGSKEDCVRRLVQADQKDALAGTVAVKKTSAELAEEAQEAAQAQAEEAAIAKARAHLLTVRLQEEEDFANMKTNEVRQELKKRGLSTGGTKSAMMERLAMALERDHAAKLEQAGRGT